jgi:hypothetical protein
MDQPRRTEVVDRPPTDSASPDQALPAPSSTPATQDPGPTPARAEQARPETGESIGADTHRQVRGLLFALGCAVAVAVAVILTAINVQSGRILDREGHGWTFRVLFGPDVLSGINLQGWRVVSEPASSATRTATPTCSGCSRQRTSPSSWSTSSCCGRSSGTVSRGRWRTFGTGHC